MSESKPSYGDSNPYSPPQTESTADDPTRGQFCFISTPDHQRSLWGRWVYIYTGSGWIAINGSSLVYTFKKGEQIVIPLASISDVGIGHFSRIAKPIRLDYCAVTFKQDGDLVEQLFFTPTNDSSTPVWSTNRVVAEWAERIRESSTVMH